jgi:hypothetical protein
MSASDEELIAAAIEAVGPGETHVVVLARLIVAALRADGRLVDPKISTEGPGSTTPEPGPPEVVVMDVHQDDVLEGEYPYPADELPGHGGHDYCVHRSQPCGDGCPADNDGPCQPIGCDNGYHLPGCQFIETDAAAGHSTEDGAER